MPPLVAITDGASTGEDLIGFEPSRRPVSDWYHLAKRVYENLSLWRI